MYEAEESLISCLLSDSESIEKVYTLEPQMFQSEVYGKVFYECKKAFDKHTELTLAEIKQKLQANGIKDYEIDDALERALNTSAMGFQAEGYGKAILNHYKKTCVDRILERTPINEGNIDDGIARLITDLEGLQEGRSSTTLTVAEMADQYKDTYFTDDEKPKTDFGIERIDDLVGGLEGGDVAIVGGRPASGKSAFITQLAWHYADMGIKVGIYNLEMSEKQILERMIAQKSGIDLTRIRMAKAFQNDEKGRYERAINALLKQDRIYITTGAKKVSEIRAESRHMGYGVIIIDYIQLLTSDGKYAGNRAAEVGQISRDIKMMAMNFKIPVVALSQLNRASEGRVGKEPTMGELREAGNLEQDASVIILLWDKNPNDRSQKGCKVEKARNGKTGRADLVFDGSHMRFKSEDEVTPFDRR